MPFTPFHFGPAILIGLLALKYIDFPTFVAANVIVDWRATLVFFGLMEGPLHSWPSTYPGSLPFAIILGAVMIYLRPIIDNQLREMKVVQEFNTKKIFLAAFSGVILHVTLDAFHHPNIQPFIIKGIKPLFGLLSTFEVRMLCFACLLLSFPIYTMHVNGWIDISN